MPLQDRRRFVRGNHKRKEWKRQNRLTWCQPVLAYAQKLCLLLVSVIIASAIYCMDSTTKEIDC